MKFLTLLIISFFSLTVHSQSLHVDFYGGIANYQGDLQTKRFDLNQSRPAAGLGLSYHISNKLIVRGAANYIAVSGSDATGSTAKNVAYRNLRFKSNIWEGQLALEYNLVEIETHGFSPYLFAGVAAFHFSPYSFDSSGNKVFLRTLGTEGQGLSAYPNRKMYSNNQFAIPFGGGVKLAFSDNLEVGLELGLRKLFTDYLDDISGSYADSAILAAGRGALAPAFAFRGREINSNAVYPAEGSIRGNPKNKDWYFTTGIKISYRLAGKTGSGNSRGGNRNKLGCPANVY